MFIGVADRTLQNLVRSFFDMPQRFAWAVDTVYVLRVLLDGQVMQDLKDVRQFLQKTFPNEDRLWITHPEFGRSCRRECRRRGCRRRPLRVPERKGAHKAGAGGGRRLDEAEHKYPADAAPGAGPGHPLASEDAGRPRGVTASLHPADSG